MCRSFSTAVWHPLTILSVGFAASVAQAADWPQFLGPNRNGISAETALIDKFPEGGPKQLWRVKGGVGMSAFAVSGDRAVTMIQRDGKQFVVALDLKSGETLWQTGAAPEFTNSMGDGPRTTPVIAGGKVYAYTGEGVLAALSLEDGRELWRREAIKEHKGRVADYGTAGSPLVVGGKVIVIVGAPGPTVVAYDAASGEPAWTAGDDPSGYASPTLLEVGGRQQIVIYSGASVLGLAPESGAVLWRYPYVTEYQCNTATPIAYDGQVLISSGENHGSALVSLTPSGDKFEVQEVWTSLGPRSVLRSEWQTPILLDGKLYGFDNVGSAGPVTHLTCVEAATGKRLWQQTRFGKGNLIAADGKLWMSTMDGELVIARVTPTGYEELGRATVIGTTRQSPTLAGGRLLLRDDSEIVCLDVRDE
jgi:outer membrane protein assembly factor BamB